MKLDYKYIIETALNLQATERPVNPSFKHVGYLRYSNSTLQDILLCEDMSPHQIVEIEEIKSVDPIDDTQHVSVFVSESSEGVFVVGDDWESPVKVTF